jgi:gamma-glutamyltranspeptidase/glutathione hydrolase/leukotriene-C4 hydrolase
MLSDRNVINEYMEKINDNFIHPTSYYGSDDFVIDNGTAHTSLIAPNGDAVAITSSINLVYENYS